MNGSPTWYDLLGVAPDATSDEVRAAWKAQIADLEPGDRRFDALTRAAKVLLDPASRAAYDASLETVAPASAARDDAAGDDAAQDHAAQDHAAQDHATQDHATQQHARLTDVEKDRERRRLMRHRSREQATERRPQERRDRAVLGRRALVVPTWLLLALAALATVLVAATAWVWLENPTGDDEAAREAQNAAERAVVPVLSYDHEDLEGSQERAQALMTGSYREEYDKLFAVIAENAPETQTKVGAQVVASGIVRASENRVQVLVFVDRPTTNKASTEPVVYKDQVTLSMQRVDDEWLVDDMVTTPVSG